MNTILYSRTFIIVGVMLLITALTAKLNKAFETALELWATVIGSFVVLIAVFIFAESFPINLLLVAAFSGLMGWEIGPTIQYYGDKYKEKKILKSHGIHLKRGEKPTDEQLQEIAKINVSETDGSTATAQWHNIVFQAIFATAMAVFASATLVFFTNINFGFLGGFLFIALLMLIIMSLLNAFIFKSPVFDMVKAYIGVIIFTLYLLYDFDRLEKLANNNTWSAAIDIAVNIYLDIINLFLDLLQILASSDN